MLIFFEGVDKSGKSTLIRELNKKLNYKHTLIDRGPISNLVYNKIMDRDIDEPQDTLNELKKCRCLIVYVEAETLEIRKRMLKHNEVLIDKRLYDIVSVKDMFRKEIKNCGIKTIKINTTTMDIETCVDILTDKIKKEEL